MRSAEELLREIDGIAREYGNDWGIPSDKATETKILAEIRARDKEIVEACRTRITESHDSLGKRLAYPQVMECLDSILRELQQGQLEDLPDTRGEGTIGRPFTKQYVGKSFARLDEEGREFSLGICERDFGYELRVIPSRSGPVRTYKINPDGSIIDLAPQ